VVISDTNVLSSLAAGDGLPILLALFTRSPLIIPPSVHQELQVGLERSKTYLAPVIQAIVAQQIVVIPLSANEEQLMEHHPHKLNIGERQAIALAQTRQAILLSNDKRATRYCQQNAIRVLNLPDILRLLWVRRIASQDDVRTLIVKMEQVENLMLTETQRREIFAPRAHTS
jgi:predicted nucleic acid-binding protein